MQVVYQDEKFIKGRDNGDYYSGFYVLWLEEQLEESRKQVHMMAAKRNKWKGIAEGLLEDLEELEEDGRS